MAFVENQTSKKSLSRWESDLFKFILDWISGTHFISIKTSGSTGDSKWMKVEKEKMVKSAQLTGDFFNLQKNDKALLCLPVEFIAGKMMVVRAFVLELNLIPVEPSGNPLKDLNKAFDFAAMTPMQVHAVLNFNDGFQKLNKIRNLIIGGGEVNQLLFDQIKNLENNTYHTYGMTETLTHVALLKMNGRDSDDCYKALPGVKFEKDNRDCLVISAAHLAPNKIITNDIVNLKAENKFEYIGRFDNIINSGGIKMSPEKVEQVLSGYIPGRFIIAGIPDEKLGQKVVLIVEGVKNSQTGFSGIINSVVKEKYERPKEIFYLNSFPETENGKIKRRKTLEMILPLTDNN
ncbi:MAG: AMP-binding protein [Bacteroidales bacterium]